MVDRDEYVIPASRIEIMITNDYELAARAEGDD
jgi:hypothetical protein